MLVIDMHACQAGEGDICLACLAAIIGPDAKEGNVQRGEQNQQLAAVLNSPEFNASKDAGKIRTASEKLACLDREMEDAYCRWNELEDMASQLGG